MVVNALIDKAFTVIATIILDIFQDLNFDTLASHFAVLSSYLLDVVAYVFYFLPVTYLIPIFVVVGAILAVRIQIALARLLFEFVGMFF